MDIYSAGPNSASDNSNLDGSGSDPQWTAPGAQRYIGIIIVVVLAFIALLCWMFFARWPRQQIRRVFSNRNRCSLPESSLHHNQSSSSSTTAAATTGAGRGRSEFELGGELEKGRGDGLTKGTRDGEMGQSKTEIRILEVKEDEEASQWRSSEKIMTTVQLPQRPTPCVQHKKSRSYGLDWIKRQTSPSSSPRTRPSS